MSDADAVVAAILDEGRHGATVAELRAAAASAAPRMGAAEAQSVIAALAAMKLLRAGSGERWRTTPAGLARLDVGV